MALSSTYGFCIHNILVKLFSFLFYRDSAAVMLSGQVADGFATIFAGELV